MKGKKEKKIEFNLKKIQIEKKTTKTKKTAQF